jgi:hypothetical protein
MDTLEQDIIELEKKKQDLKNQINDIENNISNTSEPIRKRQERKRVLLAEIEDIDYKINELRVYNNPSKFVDQIEKMLLDEPVSLGDIHDACKLANKQIKLKIKSNGLNPDYFILLGRLSEVLRDTYLAFDCYTTGITLHRLLHIEVNEDLSRRLKLVTDLIYSTGIYYQSIKMSLDIIDDIIQNDRKIFAIPLIMRKKEINRERFIEKMGRISKSDLDLILFFHGFKSDEFNFDRSTMSIGKDILEYYQNRCIQDLLIQKLQDIRPDINWEEVYDYIY